MQGPEGVTNAFTVLLCTRVCSHGSGSSPPLEIPSLLPFPLFLAQSTHFSLHGCGLTNPTARGFKCFRAEQQQDRQSSLLPVTKTSLSIPLILHYAQSSPLHQKKGWRKTTKVQGQRNLSHHAHILL